MTAWRGVAMVGLRGSGKSTLGHALAEHMGWAFADTDQLLADRVGMPAGEFLARVGEAEFRRVEQEVTLPALAEPGPFVLALGGGAVLSAAVREALQAGEILVVWCQAPVAELIRRVAVTPRPALTPLPLAQEVEILAQRRRAFYEDVADLWIATHPQSVTACCAAIASHLRQPRKL